MVNWFGSVFPSSCLSYFIFPVVVFFVLLALVISLISSSLAFIFLLSVLDPSNVPVAGLLFCFED